MTTAADLDRIKSLVTGLTALGKVQPGDAEILIDCGAFLGFGSIRMSRDATAGRVFAIEASSDCFALLKRNVETNGASNVPELFI